MRYLVLSDIHANLEALEAVLAAAPAHDAVWNLGDIVGYGASPNEVIDRVIGLGSVFVRGNHDRVCAGQRPFEDFNPVAQSSVRWTQAMLTTPHAEWLRQMQQGPLHPDGPQVSCVHGSPLDEDQYVTTVRDAWLPLLRAERRINFFGHTHVQGAFATNGEEWFDIRPDYPSREGAVEYCLELRPNARYMINPGSVGQPRDRDWRAAYALYDDEAMMVTFYRTPYDITSAQKRIYDYDLPQRLAHRLAEGK